MNVLYVKEQALYINNGGIKMKDVLISEYK